MNNANDKRLFLACFAALITTAFGFIIRALIMNDWARDFGLTETQKGEIFGVGLWPFAISIVLFSLFIDRVGYGKAMVFAFVCHLASAVITIGASYVAPGKDATAAQLEHGRTMGYWLLYGGNFVVALGNGTVEAVINPVVATMFAKQKTKWLNILHAGWPGGLVLGGLLTIAMGTTGLIGAGMPEPIAWKWKVALILIPIVVYGLMMLGCKFPVNERVAAGVPYKDMLKEAGMLGALIVVALIVSEVGRVFNVPPLGRYIAIGVLTLAYGAYVMDLGRPMFVFLLLVMIPLATTELGTDSWITPLMESEMGKLHLSAGWVLVYTSFIMFVLRFFAGPIVHRFSPLGLLAFSSVLAAAGLFALSSVTGAMIFAAATLYGFGKTFFWPTMLGVVSEQFPKGGALTLNATGGVGMLSVGVLGAQLLGFVQDQKIDSGLKDSDQAIHAAYVTTEKESLFGSYKAFDQDKFNADTKLVSEAKQRDSAVQEELRKKSGKPATDDEVEAALRTDAEYQKIVTAEEYKQQKTIADTVDKVDTDAKKGTLRTAVAFPLIMLVCYIGLIFYFQSRGGYKQVHLEDEAGPTEY